MSATPPKDAKVKASRPISQHIQRNMVAGVLTLIPIVVTWVVVSFLLSFIQGQFEPLSDALAETVGAHVPTLANLLRTPAVQTLFAILVILFVIYFIGWAASRVIGARIIGLFDSLVTRIPLVKELYGALKALVNVLQRKPDSTQRVVMIEFPSPDMKTVGLVTRTMRDEATGRELAAVFVPTTPNPTGGYLEIVPVDKLVATDWTLDEAMSFVISGGAVARDKIAYSKSTIPGMSPPAKKAPPAGDTDS